MHTNNTNSHQFLIKVFYVILAGFVSCSSPGRPDVGHDYPKDTIVIKDYNLIIAPDLSNRISFNVHPKPLHDTVLINGVINEINNILNLQNRRVGQKDIFSLDFINPGILNNNWINVDACKIDFSRFSNVHENAAYKRNKLANDQRLFKEQVSKLYEHSINKMAGADIWNYFNQTVGNQLKIMPPQVRLEGDVAISRELKNLVVLFTDGYIENVNIKKEYQLSKQQVDDIRKNFNASKSKNLQAYIDGNAAFGIAVTTQSLKDLNVVVFEMLDRSLNAQGVAKQHPTDFEIMSIVWKNWLKQSGCKHVEVYKAVADKKLMLERLKDFLKII